MTAKPRVWENNSDENTTAGLIDLCREWVKSEFVMVEVGCFAGVSTEVFASFAAKVYAVDPWTLAMRYTEIPMPMLAEAERRFDDVTREYPNIVRIKNFSVIAADTFEDASLDAVYIDGEHTEIAFRTDVAAWRPKIKSGGLLMGHDHGQVENYLRWKPVKIYPESSWVVQL